MRRTLDVTGTTGGKATTERLQPEHVPGFWIHLIEADARAIAQGMLPDRVRVDVADMMADRDAKMRAAEAQLAKRRTHG